MKLLVYIFLTVTFFSCSNSEGNIDFNFKGVWKYQPTKSNNVIDNENQLELPLTLVGTKFNLSDKFIDYKIENEQVIFFKNSKEYKYDWSFEGNILCFNNNSFCLEKIKPSFPKIDSSLFHLKTSVEFFQPTIFELDFYHRKDSIIASYITRDSFGRNNKELKLPISKEEASYLIRLLERIPNESYNKIFNNSLSHCEEYSIDFFNAHGEFIGIETCGWRDENPFELKALLLNTLVIMDKYMKE